MAMRTERNAGTDPRNRWPVYSTLLDASPSAATTNYHTAAQSSLGVIGCSDRRCRSRFFGHGVRDDNSVQSLRYRAERDRVEVHEQW